MIEKMNLIIKIFLYVKEIVLLENMIQIIPKFNVIVG